MNSSLSLRGALGGRQVMRKAATVSEWHPGKMNLLCFLTSFDLSNGSKVLVGRKLHKRNIRRAYAKRRCGRPPDDSGGTEVFRRCGLVRRRYEPKDSRERGVLRAKEFFLLLSSIGLAFRRCELAWVDGSQVGIRFVKMDKASKKKGASTPQ
jgi:hypothetical protein